MCILLPIIASLFTALLLYLLVRIYYSSQAALCAVFCFAICIPAIFIGSAGSVDRDSLELLLMIPILFSLYNSGRGNAFNFISSIIFSVSLLVLLAYLWSWIAIPVCAILMGPCTAYKAISGSRYHKLLILLFLTLGGIYVLLSYQDYSKLLYRGVSELQYLDITGLVMYIPLILPFVYGIITLKRRMEEIDVFLLFWLVTAFLAGLMLSRLQLFLIPVVCMISGIGLWQFYADNKSEVSSDVQSVA